MKGSPDLPTRDNARLHAAALRIARRCRHIVQGCLREEEWADADHEFYVVILEEMERTFGQNAASVWREGGDPC